MIGTNMVKHGVAPFLECSSRGDKRFSAFYAIVDGKSIEEAYQAAKILEDGTTGHTWKEVKGKKAVNATECAILYSALWDKYISQHPELLVILKTYSGLSDMFGQPDHCCQATELWRIRGLTYEVLQANVNKLEDHKARGKMRGSGNDR